MATTTYVLLESITLTSNATSVLLSNIDQGFRDLVLVARPKGTEIGQTSVKLNNTGGARVWMEAEGTAANSNGLTSDSYFRFTNNIYADYTDNYSSWCAVLDYSQTNKYKPVYSRATKNSNYYGSNATAHTYKSNSAITSAEFLNAGGQTFVTGSTFEIYGIVG